MNLNHPNRLAQLLLVAAFLIGFSYQTVSGDEYNRIDDDLTYIGDEAFTEPIETVQLSCAETGIVGDVLVKRGDKVQPGDLLFELNMTVLAASKNLASAKANGTAKLKAAQVEFEQKQRRHQKLVALLQDNAGSPEEVEVAQANMEVARENISGIREELQQSQLELKRIESQMELRRIRTPISGDVVDIRRKTGEFLSHNDPHVITVVKLDTLRAVFHLPTARASQFKKGDRAKVLLTETNQVTEAIIDYVAPITSADSGRVRIDALIDNSSGKFRSGVRCRLDNQPTRQTKSIGVRTR